MNYSNFESIKNADRNPIPNVQNAIAELNGFSKEIASSIEIQWLQGLDDMGPCLHATVKFQNIDTCLNFAKEVYTLQEKVDHHSNFEINNFLKVDMKLSTHHPIPAITHVDFLFAKQTILILKGLSEG